MSHNIIGRDFDHTTGILEEFHHDSVTGNVVIERKQDMAPHLDHAKDLFNQHNRVGYGDSNGQHLVARIPLVAIELWKEQGFDWFNSTDKERREWLDRPENAVFKTRPGKLNGVTANRLSCKVS